MKDHRIRRIRRLPEPLRTSLVHETLSAIAQGTDVPARVTSDALIKFCSEIGPPLIGRHRLDLAHLSVLVGVHLLRDRFTDEYVVDRGIPVCTQHARIVEQVARFDRLREPLPLDDPRVVLPAGPQDLSTHSVLDLPPVHHPRAGHPDDRQLVPFDLLFLDQSHERPDIAALGHDTDFALSARKIVGQIVLTGAVPDQSLHVLLGPEKRGSAAQRYGTLLVSDDQIHLPLTEEVSGDIPQQLLSLFHVYALMVGA